MISQRYLRDRFILARAYRIPMVQQTQTTSRVVKTTWCKCEKCKRELEWEANRMSNMEVIAA